MIFETSTWETKVVMLWEYKRIHGHLRGLGKGSPALAKWTTRVRMNRNSLSPEQVRQLEEVGFIYDSEQDRWENHIKDLLEFKNTHGHLGVPKHYRFEKKSFERNSSLMKWVYYIRSEKLHKLSPERIKDLDQLGFQHGRDASTGLLIAKPARRGKGKGTSKKNWEKNTAALCDSQAERGYDKKWKQHIQEPLAFKKAHGHCEVPVNTRGNSNLAEWVGAIRHSKTTRNMSAERMEELDNIGLRHGRDPSTGLTSGIIDSTKKLNQQTQNEGSSPKQEMREHVHAPQDFQALDDWNHDDSQDNDDSEDGFVSSGARAGENMAPEVDRKKCLEEDFTKTDQPRREVPSQVRMVDLFDAVPLFKAQDLQHYNCVTLISCQRRTA